ncbi:MAG: hypothetical protein QM775_08755 [Pirellulales bacterium]
MPISVVAEPEWEVTEEVESLEEEFVGFGVEIKYLQPNAQGTIKVEWGDGSFETFELDSLERNSSGEIVGNFSHRYIDSGEFAVIWTLEAGDIELTGTTEVTITDIVPVITFSGQLNALAADEEGASGTIKGKITHRPMMGVDADPDPDSYELSVTVDGEDKSAELDENFEFVVEYEFDDDRPVDESDLVEVVANVTIDGEDPVEETTVIQLVNKLPWATLSFPELTAPVAYADEGFDELQWLQDNVQVTAHDVRDGASVVSQEFRIIAESYDPDPFDDDYSSVDDAFGAYGDPGDTLLVVTITDGDDPPILNVFNLSEWSIPWPDHFREEMYQQGTEVEEPGDPEERQGQLSPQAVIAQAAQHLAGEEEEDEDDDNFLEPKTIDLVDGEPQNEINLLGNAATTFNATYTSSYSVKWYTREDQIKVIDLHNGTFEIQDRTNTRQEILNEVSASASVRIVVDIVRGPQFDPDFNIDTDGAVTYKQEPQVINGVKTYLSDSFEYRILAVCDDMEGFGGFDYEGERAVYIGGGTVTLRGGTLGFELTSTVIDGTAGETLRGLENAGADNLAVVRLTRNYIGTLADAEFTSKSGETTISFHFAAPSSESVTDSRKRGSGSDVAVVSGATSSSSNSYTATIADGADYVDIVIRATSDSNIELDELVNLVIDSANSDQNYKGHTLTTRLGGGAQVNIFDEDSIAAYSSQNVDTESTGLTRELTFNGKAYVDLFDGRESWDAPFGSDVLPTLQGGYASAGYVTYNVVGPNGENLGVRDSARRRQLCYRG